MANWLSIKLAAEKYGIPEQQIREWVRLNYLTCSSFDMEPYDDTNLLVDTDEIDKALELNALKSYPDDDTTERIPKDHLDWLYRENARLEKAIDDLLADNCARIQREEKLMEELENMTNLSNEILALQAQITQKHEFIIYKKKQNIYSFLHNLFVRKNNEDLI